MRHLLSLLVLGGSLSFPLLAQSDASAPASPTERLAFGQRLKVPGISNAGKINDSLYRGAQPHEKGLPELKKLGITTIVDLRGENRDSVEWEGRRAASLGMRFVHIPVSGWAPPTDDQVAQFLSLFHNDPQQKIFVHCRFGDDRTGVFVAIYRMALEKWPAEQSMKEMYFFGFNGFWHPAMKTFIHDFPAHLSSAPALASFRPAYSQP